MTDLVVHDVQTPAVDPGRRSAPDLQRILDLHRSATQAVAGLKAGSLWPAPRVEDAFNRADAVERANYHARCLAERLAEASPVHVIRRCRDLASQALDGLPDRRVVVAAVGLLIGSRARQPESPQTFIRALEFDLLDLGFSPAVIVVALQRLRREAKFTPEICEVIAACQAERDRLQKLLERVEHVGAYRAALEAAVANVPALLARAEAMPQTKPPLPTKVRPGAADEIRDA